MQNILRLSIFSICIAVGVGLAVSLATQLQPPEKVAVSAVEPNSHANLGTPPPESMGPSGNVGAKSGPRHAKTATSNMPQPRDEAAPAPPANVPANPLTEPLAAVIAPYQFAIAQQVQNLQNQVNNMQNQQAQDNRAAMDQQFEILKKVNANQANANAAPDNTNNNPMPADETPEEVPAPAASPKPVTDIHRAEGDNNLELNLRDSDLRQVLDMISEQTGLNILASPNVKGSVTATLKNVDARAALTAILKSTGFVSKVEGSFIYVGTPEEINAIDNSKERLTTRVYHPNYIKAHEVQMLITPLLTPGVGKVSVTTAAEIGVSSDSSGAGGDAFAGGEVLLVRDYQAVLWQIDQIVQDIDKRPRQVSIESMILSVTLNDQYKMGIDFQLLRQKANLNIYLSSPQSSLASIDPSAGGLNIGFLGSSIGSFVEALETIGDTNVIASPRVMCLNKQKAEILIGSKLGYISTTVTQTSSTQTVNFLQVGTQLRIRPYIYNDGTIRLEVHPELSTGSVQVQGNFTLPTENITEVTTNVMCQDGATVVIGGLIREELDNSTSQIPLFGNLPWVGPLFRHTTQSTIRNEIIVLITPRITCDADNAIEGNKVTSEYLNRQSIYADKMSPIGKRHCGEKYFRLSHAAWAAGDATTAFRYVNLSIHFDPLNLEATNLRQEIINANPEFDEPLHRRLRAGLDPATHPHKNYTKQGYPWQSPPEPDYRAPGIETYDPGQPGTNRTVSPTTKLQGRPASVVPASYAAPDSKPNDAKQSRTKPSDTKPTEAKRSTTKPEFPPPVDVRLNAPPFAANGSGPNPLDMKSTEPKQLGMNSPYRNPPLPKRAVPPMIQPNISGPKLADEKLAPVIDNVSNSGGGSTAYGAKP